MKISSVIAIALAALGLGGARTMSAQNFEKGYIYVDKVNLGDDTPNYLKIHVPGNFSWQHGCSTPWFVVSKYPITDERTKAWLAIALESFRSRKQVHVRTSGCTGGFGIGYPILVNIQLQQAPSEEPL